VLCAGDRNRSGEKWLGGFSIEAYVAHAVSGALPETDLSPQFFRATDGEHALRSLLQDGADAKRRALTFYCSI